MRRPCGETSYPRHAAIAIALLAAALGPGYAVAVGERPTRADLVACGEFARGQVGVPAYIETAPLSPFPSRVSGVSPWTGPITGTRSPNPARQSLGPGPVDSPEISGRFGAGGGSQEAMSEPGHVDPRFKEAFEACMRSRGF